MVHETLIQQLGLHQWVFSTHRSSERNLPSLKLNWTITKHFIHKQLKFTCYSHITQCDIIYTKFVTITNQLTPKKTILLATINPKNSVTDVLPATLTRSSATTKSTACPSCLVGVLYDISPEKSCWWLINHFYIISHQATELDEIMQNNGSHAIQCHSRSPILVPSKSPYATSY